MIQIVCSLYHFYVCNSFLIQPSRYISGDSMSPLLWFWHGDNLLLPNLARWWNLKLLKLYTLPPPHSIHLPLPISLPFSLPALGGCQILTLGGATNHWKSSLHVQQLYSIYSKDDVRSPFVKPPWFQLTNSVQVPLQLLFPACYCTVYIYNEFCLCCLIISTI
jgi:hypothetical protein